MTDEESFHRALDLDPSDSGLRLVFADWLRECGDPRADGMAWMGENGKWPDYYAESWFWHTCSLEECEHRYALLPNHDSIRGYFSTRRAAEDALCRAFAERPDLFTQEVAHA